MATMAESLLASDVQSRCDALRASIKEWERDFFAQNGVKPAKKDMAAIKDKYREYEKLCDKLKGAKNSSKSRSKEVAPRSPKRKATEDLACKSPSKRVSREFATPRKPKAAAVKVTSTPSKQQENEEIQVADTPMSARAIAVGPTPQKDGIPIGLFDHVSAAMLAGEQTPRAALQDMDGNIMRTPSKLVPGTPGFDKAKLSKTPMSTGKRFLLDMFATPKDRKASEKSRTPSSIDKQFQTPAFLKRYSEPTLTTVEEESPRFSQNIPWKRPQFGRSLSCMIQANRKEEDDRADAELDILRELEGGAPPPPKPKRKAAEFEDVVLVPETQLDEDGFIPSDVEAELTKIDAAEAAGAEKTGQPARGYKKKGLKRQTKRVNMRPVRSRPKQAATKEEDDGSDDDEPSTIPETQLDDINDDGFTAEQDEDFEEKSKTKTSKATKSTASKAAAKPATKKKGPDLNNYRRLNIKNKNSKANGRRFGRRR